MEDFEGFAKSQRKTTVGNEDNRACTSPICDNKLEDYHLHDKCVIHRKCISHSSLSYTPDNCGTCQSLLTNQEGQFVTKMCNLISAWRKINGQEEVVDMRVRCVQRNYNIPLLSDKQLAEKLKKRNLTDTFHVPLSYAPDNCEMYQSLLKDQEENGIITPLSIKSQIFPNLATLMEEGPAFAYFMEFLQYNKVDHYAQCYIECEKFKELSKYINGISSKSNICSIKDGLNNQDESKNTLKTQHEIPNEIAKPDEYCSRVLPDLVKNIPKNVPVTPLPSPDDISCGAISQETESICNDILSNTVRTFENNDNELNVSNYCVNISINTHKNKLKELIFEICDKYINKLKNTNINDCFIKDIRMNVARAENIFEHNLFIPIQKEIYRFLEREFYQAFFRSEYFLKFLIDVFTSQKFGLQDLLLCDTALPYFMEYMEQEGGQSLIEFWMSTYNFKMHFEEELLKAPSNLENTQADAMVLYDKYFSLQATHSIGFSDRIRFLVETNICQEEGPSPPCFDVPLKVVQHVLSKNYLPGYLSSTLHIKFVSELVNNLQINSLERKKRRDSTSTCSSEHSTVHNSSIGHCNTLLAMDSSAMSCTNVVESGVKLLKTLDESPHSIRIDSTLILDPELLWRRKIFTKLSCGYVDELGRFESDLQPEPDRKSESRFAQKLKNFVQIGEKKVKEDMAYKIAEMIIRDVTNVTLKGSKTHTMKQSSSEMQIRNLPSSLARSSSETFLP